MDMNQTVEFVEDTQAGGQYLRDELREHHPPPPWKMPKRTASRNRLCPCGSGKRAKKCCLKHIATLNRAVNKNKRRSHKEGVK